MQQNYPLKAAIHAFQHVDQENFRWHVPLFGTSEQIVPGHKGSRLDEWPPNKWLQRDFELVLEHDLQKAGENQGRYDETLSLETVSKLQFKRWWISCVLDF